MKFNTLGRRALIFFNAQIKQFRQKFPRSKG